MSGLFSIGRSVCVKLPRVRPNRIEYVNDEKSDLTRRSRSSYFPSERRHTANQEKVIKNRTLSPLGNCYRVMSSYRKSVGIDFSNEKCFVMKRQDK